ncbi:hypothetical protein NDU88_002796 [Pleurodeles waltl]|uniref:Uncharacterized protein n=1 Tax=Pleurodeles waltl TaxID=8319 RepID=A0AAV7MNS3_PLEWA|nr:hypothetical protein NDU88_002796 [Pleurodeles waltl]
MELYLLHEANVSGDWWRQVLAVQVFLEEVCIRLVPEISTGSGTCCADPAPRAASGYSDEMSCVPACELLLVFSLIDSGNLAVCTQYVPVSRLPDDWRGYEGNRPRLPHMLSVARFQLSIDIWKSYAVEVTHKDCITSLPFHEVGGFVDL